MRVPRNGRDWYKKRKEPRTHGPTGRLEAVRAPPSAAYKELAKAGLLPIEGPNLVFDWCLCTHRRGAHGPEDSPCEAHRCPCVGYTHDPKYNVEGPTGSVRVGQGRIVQSPGTEPGKLRLHFQRDPEVKEGEPSPPE